MSVHLDYYFLSMEGRRKFEEWRDELGITEGKEFKILECMYKKGPQMISQIAAETKFIGKEVLSTIEALVHDGYIQSFAP